MSNKNGIGLNFGLKAGLLLSALLLISVAVVQSTTAIFTKAQDVQTPDEQMCPTVYEPVCGEDGNTYGNICNANNAGVKVKYEGECKEDDQDGRALRDAQNYLEQARKDIENRKRELKNNFRGSKIDLTPVNSAIDQWSSAVTELESYLNSGDIESFWDAQQNKEQDSRSAVDEAFRNVYDQQQKADASRAIEEKKRSIKDNERAVKEAQKQKRDVTKLTEFLNQIKSVLAQMESLVQQPEYDMQEFQDLNRSFDEANTAFWAENQKGDAFRIIEEKKRSIKDKEKAVKEAQKQKRDITKLTELLNQIKSVLAQMEALTQNPDYDMQEFWDINRECDDADRLFWEENQKGDAFRMIEEKKRNMKDKEKTVKEAQKQKRDVSKLQDFIGRMTSVLNQMEALVQQAEYSMEDFRTLEQEYNEYEQAFWAENQKGDAFRIIEEKKRNLKDNERAIKEAQKQKKDATKLTKLLNQIKSVLAQMEALTQNPDYDMQEFWDLNRTCDEANTAFWEENNELNKQGREEEFKRIVTEKARMLKDIGRECKRLNLICIVPETLQNLFDQMSAAAIANDEQTFWDLNREFDDTTQEFWETHKVEVEAKEMKNRFNDLERELKDRGRWVQDVKRGAKGTPVEAIVAQAENILSQMASVIEKAKQAYAAQDYETARELIDMELNDLRQEFEDVMQGAKGNQEKMFFLKELENIEREVAGLEKALKVKKNTDPERANMCLGYVPEARSFIAQLKQAAAAGDDETLQELQMQFQELGEKVERDCGDLIPMGGNGSNYDAVKEVYVDERNRDVAQEVFSKISGEVTERVIEQIKQNSSLFNAILESAGEKFKEQIAKALEAVSFIPEQFQQELLSQKASLLEQVKEMEVLTARLQELKTVAMNELQELQNIRQQVASYNFIGTAGTEMQEEIASFINKAQGLNKEQIRVKISELKSKAAEKIEEAREEKFEKGVIPFLDADDDQWYSRYAAQAKRIGYVKGAGDGTKLEANRDTNVAEAVTLFGRVVEGAKEAGIIITGNKPAIIIQNGKTFRSLPEWARDGAEALAKVGVDVNDVFDGKQAGQSVSRAEVAILLDEVLDLPDSESRPRFADIEQASSDEVQSIASVNEAGLMTGYTDGSNEFGVDDPLNRAALVKVLIKVNEDLGGEVQETLPVPQGPFPTQEPLPVPVE